MNKKGFTLLELLVVVLIIGILAAIALPQYQVAVKKATLAKYMAIVKAMKDAQDRYFLSNGVYAVDVDTLDISLPLNDSCTKTTVSGGARYDCGNERFGIFSNSNAQAGDKTIRYLQFFDNYTHSDMGDIKRGSIACYSNGEVSRKTCKKLGEGKEYVSSSNNWDYHYLLNNSSDN